MLLPGGFSTEVAELRLILDLGLATPNLVALSCCYYYIQTKLTVYCHRQFLTVTLKSDFRVQQNLCFVSNNCAASAKQSERKLVSLSFCDCLVPWSVIPVDASDSLDTIMDVVRAGV